MTLKTVLFAVCDLCGKRWEPPANYKPLAIGIGNQAWEIDVCDEDMPDLFTHKVIDLIDVARVTAKGNSTRRRDRGMRVVGEGTDNNGRYPCLCGRDFSSKQGLAMHITRSPDEGHGQAITTSVA